MKVTKTHLIDHLYRNCGFSRDESSTTIESLLEIIKKTLESGEDILISGFGKFTVKEKKKRRGRNPQTDNCLVPDAKWIITFKCSDKLRKNLNDNNKK